MEPTRESMKRSSQRLEFALRFLFFVGHSFLASLGVLLMVSFSSGYCLALLARIGITTSAVPRSEMHVVYLIVEFLAGFVSGFVIYSKRTAFRASKTAVWSWCIAAAWLWASVAMHPRSVLASPARECWDFFVTSTAASATTIQALTTLPFLCAIGYSAGNGLRRWNVLMRHRSVDPSAG